jgi:DNA (cytosine-5)-methyltransferase 1
VVAWRKGDRAPDIPKWTRPPAWCPRCEKTVRAVQAWKRPDRPRGRYGQQYVYRCPNLDCRGQQVFPDVLPAAVAIDWTLPGERIGDRARPLAPKTLARIEAGLRRYAQPLLAPAGGTWNDDTRPITEPFRTRTTRDTEALVVPLRNNGVARPAATSPAPTVAAAGNHHALVMRNHTARGDQGQMCTPVTEPLRTILAHGPRPSLIRWDHLLVPYYGNSAARPVGEPMGTVTTVDRNALVGPEVAVEDCAFRMLEPHEIQAAMAFPPGYVVLGNKRERVRQLGNAVTPPAARDLIAAVTEAIIGADLEPTNPAAQSTVPAGRNP